MEAHANTEVLIIEITRILRKIQSRVITTARACVCKNKVRVYGLLASEMTSRIAAMFCSVRTVFAAPVWVCVCLCVQTNISSNKHRLDVSTINIVNGAIKSDGHHCRLRLQPFTNLPLIDDP